jgi:hypothetical protein
MQCLFRIFVQSRPTARVTRQWMERDNAVLTEPAQSHARCEAVVPPSRPWRSSGDRVQALLGGFAVPDPLTERAYCKSSFFNYFSTANR